MANTYAKGVIMFVYKFKIILKSAKNDWRM